LRLCLPDPDRPPGLFTFSFLTPFADVDKFSVFLFGQFFERFDSLIGTDQGLAAQINLSGDRRAFVVDSPDSTRKVPGISPARDARVDIEARRVGTEVSQLIDLSTSLGIGFGSPRGEFVVVPQDIGQQLPAQIAVIPPDLKQRIEFEGEFFHG
jgi:hypothetical protein